MAQAPADTLPSRLLGEGSEPDGDNLAGKLAECCVVYHNNDGHAHQEHNGHNHTVGRSRRRSQLQPNMQGPQATHSRRMSEPEICSRCTLGCTSACNDCQKVKALVKTPAIMGAAENANGFKKFRERLTSLVTGVARSPRTLPAVAAAESGSASSSGAVAHGDNGDSGAGGGGGGGLALPPPSASLDNELSLEEESGRGNRLPKSILDHPMAKLKPAQAAAPSTQSATPQTSNGQTMWPTSIPEGGKLLEEAGPTPTGGALHTQSPPISTPKTMRNHSSGSNDSSAIHRNDSGVSIEEWFTQYPASPLSFSASLAAGFGIGLVGSLPQPVPNIVSNNSLSPELSDRGGSGRGSSHSSSATQLAASGKLLRDSESFRAAEASRSSCLINWMLSEIRGLLEVDDDWPLHNEHDDAAMEAEKGLPLEEVLLNDLNAAVVTTLDSVPEDRFRFCLESVGWDFQKGEFPPSTCEKQLEMLGHNLVTLVLNLKKENENTRGGGRSSRGRRRTVEFSSTSSNASFVGSTASLRTPQQQGSYGSGFGSGSTTGLLESSIAYQAQQEQHAALQPARARSISVPFMHENEHYGIGIPLLQTHDLGSGYQDGGACNGQSPSNHSPTLNGAPQLANSLDGSGASRSLTGTGSGLSVTRSLTDSDHGSSGHVDVVEAAQMTIPHEPTEAEIVQGITDSVGSYEIAFAELEFHKGYAGAHNRLGIGGYGEVFLASWHGTPVAVKRLLEQDMHNGEVLRDFKAEVEILSKLRHNNVVLWLGACTHPPNICVVLEALYTRTPHGPRGRSLNYLLHKSSVHISRLQALLWLEGVVKGMLYLHSRNVIHCDLNTNNVLIGNDNLAKITDFGLSRVKVQSRLSNNPSQTGIGTVNTTAPEVLRGEAYDGKKADAFSLGVMLWELVARRVPWRDWKPLRVYANLVTNGCEDVKRELVFPQDTPPTWIQLARECWADNPQERPSMDKIMQSVREMIQQERRHAHMLQEGK